MKQEYKSKKTWMFWCVWEGYRISDIQFNNEGMDDLDEISYSEYRKRLILKKENNSHETR